MIGNDVVDLALAKIQSNWKRTNYLDKIFTPSEQKFITESSNQHEAVWSLWSKKEAVYKVVIQNGGKQGYYPKKIECLNPDFDNGIVVFEGQKFKTNTKIKNGFVDTVAINFNDNFDLIRYSNDISNLFKIDGIPYYKTSSRLYPASKSHHGKFEKIVYLQTKSAF